MRRVIYSMLTSLDLYVEGPDGRFDWAKPDTELHRHFNALAATMTTHLYGRRMWQAMSAYWPTAAADPAGTPHTRDFARFWNAGEHIVFSRSLESVAHGARLVRQAVDAVRRLKDGEGTDIDVGGPGLASSLIGAGLVDEIHAYINPVVVGGGKRMIADPTGPLDLTLLGVQTFTGGVVQLRYAPRTAHGDHASRRRYRDRLVPVDDVGGQQGQRSRPDVLDAVHRVRRDREALARAELSLRLAGDVQDRLAGNHVAHLQARMGVALDLAALIHHHPHRRGVIDRLRERLVLQRGPVHLARLSDRAGSQGGDGENR